MDMEPHGRKEDKSRLERLARNSGYARGLNSEMTRHCFEVFARHLQPGRILELGPAEGVMTELLTARHFPLTVIEGSQHFCEPLRNRFPGVRVIHSLFEDAEPGGGFQSIIVAHVLEHVIDPVGLLRRAEGWLGPTGRIFAAVPNARSIHRQMAVVMGLLSHESDLSESDIHNGHRRVYDPQSFRRDLLAAGLTVEIFGGYCLKPLSNKQIEDSWTPEMIGASMVVGERYPDIAGEIYAVASRG